MLYKDGPQPYKRLIFISVWVNFDLHLMPLFRPKDTVAFLDYFALPKPGNIREQHRHCVITYLGKENPVENIYILLLEKKSITFSYTAIDISVLFEHSQMALTLFQDIRTTSAELICFKSYGFLIILISRTYLVTFIREFVI